MRPIVSSVGLAWMANFLLAADPALLVSDLPVGASLSAAISASAGIVVVDYHAEWCGPCKKLSPILSAVAADRQIRVIRVDVDQHPEPANAEGVESLPYLALYRDGKKIGHKTGLLSQAQLTAWVTAP